MKNPPLTSGLLVIFGITGDLARRYLLPALYHLAKDNLLPEHFEVIGVTRRGTSVEGLLAILKDEIEKKEQSCDMSALDALGSAMRIVKMDMTNVDEYHELKKTLDAIEDERQVCLNRLFYLSIPPQTFEEVVDFLGVTGLNTGCQHGTSDSRIMIEKPFGYDLASAKALIARIRNSFTEDQIFRIDHYLAKETAQNILTFRFSNPIFKAIWDNRSVTNISITASEAIGIEGRAAFYDKVGALRDFVQNHLLQLLSVIAMEEPKDMTSGHIHAEKLRLMKAITNISADAVATHALRGQYKGYTSEVENPGSTTETFARVKLDIDNDRWRGVPVQLQTGKQLDRKSTQVELTFSSKGVTGQDINTLVFRLQPNEGIAIDLVAKKPGFADETQRVEMVFNYDHESDGDIHPNAYERVLMDGIRGDQTLFASSEEVLESWRIVNRVVEAWAKNGDGLIIYEPGTSPEGIR